MINVECILQARQKDATPGEQRFGQEMANTLHSITKPYFLRRTKGEVTKQEPESSPTAVRTHCDVKFAK